MRQVNCKVVETLSYFIFMSYVYLNQETNTCKSHKVFECHTLPGGVELVLHFSF